MGLASRSQRSGLLAFGLTGAIAALAAAVAVPPAGASTPNLTGQWVNSANTASSYLLRESTDESVINANWAGLPPHQTLQGSFKGTLDTSGDAYEGTFNVTEGSVSVSGSGTFALRSSFFASYPTIEVTLHPDNGGQTSDFTLELFSALPLVRPDGVTDVITNPSSEPASGAVDVGESLASNGSVRTGSAARRARRKAVILGVTRFTIAPRQSSKVSVTLNRKGRSLLKKRGSLTVQVVVHMNSGSGLPAVTKAGTVTIRK